MLETLEVFYMPGAMEGERYAPELLETMLGMLELLEVMRYAQWMLEVML